MFFKLKPIGKGFKIVGMSDKKINNDDTIIWATADQIRTLKRELIKGVDKSIPYDIRVMLGV